MQRNTFTYVNFFSPHKYFTFHPIGEVFFFSVTMGEDDTGAASDF